MVMEAACASSCCLTSDLKLVGCVPYASSAQLVQPTGVIAHSKSPQQQYEVGTEQQQYISNYCTLQQLMNDQEGSCHTELISDPKTISSSFSLREQLMISDSKNQLWMTAPF